MTSNQRRAILLADQILKGHAEPAKISETDWSLLLLAAGLHRVATPPPVVAIRVLSNAEHLEGYFTEVMPPHLGDFVHTTIGTPSGQCFSDHP